MKTKILKLIDNRINGISDKNLFDALSNSFYIDFLKELRQEIEEMPEQPQWIPVTERLPEEYGRYMTYAPMLEPHYIIYFDGNEWIAKFPEKITHWQPLPLPPHP